MKFGNLLFACALFLSVSNTAYADISRICDINGYTREVQFISGRELNDATKSYKFNWYDDYALLWYAPKQVAIVELETYMFSSGDIFDRDDFRRLFGSFTYSVSGNDQDGHEYEITCRKNGRFIDPREN